MQHRHWIDYLTAISTTLASVAAAAAALFAGMQAKIADESSKRQLRAYLSTMVDDIPGDKVDNNNIFVDISVQNAGQTPAYDVSAAYVISKSPPKDLLNEEKLQIIKGSALLAANNKKSYRFYLGVNAQDFLKLRENRDEIFLYGRVNYTDVFSITHALLFCYEVYINPNDNSGVAVSCEMLNRERDH